MALLLPLFFPVWLVVGLVVDVLRSRRRLPIIRLLIFATCWAWLELLGLVAAGALFVGGRRSHVAAFYRIQEWWCRHIVNCLSRVVGLRFEVTGVSDVGEGPFVLLARHVSLADAVMSSWVVGSLLRKKPRYVLKNELKIDPCLDVFGHQLPNYFIDRASSDVASELMGIQQMAMNLSESDVAVIFPEGTRANHSKRSSRLTQLQQRSPLRYEVLSSLRHLIPPKPAGAMALLQSVPRANVLTLTHSGLEGLDSFASILRNFGKNIVKVRVHISQFDRAIVPNGDAFVAWLDDQWVKMDNIVNSYVLQTQGK